ncbi:hypothetical protein [Microbacterium oxydans]|uniref:hypothetical protein n=1 Tax=Microbacterium oxydans TaxID=82380 RepID=UPI0022B12AB2|nr:hypothetical protein [Microbacterium oxydans]MCZ4301555.1 hypothetical protein [Microbacterium oxydans]
MGLEDEGEMTTREAVAYLSERTVHPINMKIIHNLRTLGCAPVAEKRGGRLVFRREALDAYLAEFGTNPDVWHAGFARYRISELHARGIYDPALEAMFRAIDPDADAVVPSDFA